MSGIYIPGMEMARKCIRCPVNVYGRCLINDDKDVSKATADAVRDKDCPLIPVPDHGRLIDADELLKHKGNCYDADGHLLYAVGTGNILCAPTIIPAEEGDNG